MLRSIFLLFLILPVIAVGFPGGQAGRTSTASAGCGDCHGASPKVATTVTLEGGSRTVEPGSTTSFTIIIAHPTFPSAGVGITVRTTPTGTVAVGTLAVQAGTGLQHRLGQITHSSPRSLTDGNVRLTFTWEAPLQEGTYYMQAVGNAVNGNGDRDVNDAWNWMQPVAITVKAASSVAEITEPRIGTWPNPFRSGVLTLGFEAVGTYDVVIMDLAGLDVVRTTGYGTGAGLPIDVPTLPRGTYAVIARQAAITKRTLVVVE